MNIGFISTWFERGAAYVTKAYIDALKGNNNIFVYARGGESFAKGDPKWDLPYVTWGLKLSGTRINFRDFRDWITKNKIEVLFFNEQHEPDIIAYTKKNFPQIKVGSYIDYYKEDTLQDFWLYDFLICNTKRHYSVFKDHPQCYYIPWGTDIELFKPHNENNEGPIKFFHSVGMSKRKGTDLLLKSYIEGEIYKEAKLIIHSQLDFKNTFGFSTDELERYNIEVIEKTVTAPGLYYLGDIYLYPTTLDGLGLTIYEALSCGLPVITTNNAPMNEIVNNDIGFLVDVDRLNSKSNGYYWPLSVCSKKSLIKSMQYYIQNKSNLANFKDKAREFAVNELNWKNRYDDINKVFNNTEILDNDIDCNQYINKLRINKVKNIISALSFTMPNRIEHLIRTYFK